MQSSIPLPFLYRQFVKHCLASLKICEKNRSGNFSDMGYSQTGSGGRMNEMCLSMSRMALVLNF